MNRRAIRMSGLFIILLMLLIAALASAQEAVQLEAIGTANLRSRPGTDAEIVGVINNGTRYPVLGRSEFFPWYLIGGAQDGQPLGWVFADLVTLYGSASGVPVSTLEIAAGDSATRVPTGDAVQNAAQTGTAPATTADVVPTAVPGAVTGLVSGEIFIRYGPGTDYPRIGVVGAGTVLMLVGRHVSLPWVQVDFPESPSGLGWVAADLLQISGDVNALPATSITELNLPTLTPTPSTVRQAQVIGQASNVPLSPEFAALGEQLAAMMQEAGFDPATSTFGGLFVLDLQTGEAFSISGDTAFSGMSVNKIAILAEYFRTFETPLRDDQAVTVAEAMICSENISANEMLAAIGNGNPYTGAENVSQFLSQLGLERTFIFTPFANDPFITPQAPLTRQTDADQVSAQPDPFNQLTVEEVGALLNGMYQCAYNSSGLLLETFPDQFTPNECRQMLSVMNNNRIGTLLESGVPANVPIAHKHGWIDDTHGDAAVVFSPGGAYVLAAVMHGPVWLNFEQSAPLIEEISRVVYNYFNPDAPLAEVRLIEGIGDLATCNRNLLGSAVITELTTRGE
jgi:uncharacterized protein YraI